MTNSTSRSDDYLQTISGHFFLYTNSLLSVVQRLKMRSFKKSLMLAFVSLSCILLLCVIALRLDLFGIGHRTGFSSEIHLVNTLWLKPKTKSDFIYDIPLIKNVTQNSNNTGWSVPNIVHYCWYTQRPLDMRFIDYLGFMSAYKILRPDAVYFHLDHEPLGPYWEAIKALDRVKVNHTAWPTTILGRKLKDPYYYTAGSNICRTTQVLHHGGIYLDMDVLVLKSFDPLRKYKCTLGREAYRQICGGIIMAEKDSAFMQLWAQSYLDDYRNTVWAYNTGKKPTELAENFPGLVHIESTSLHRPNFQTREINKIWGDDSWKWKRNYAIHTWYNLGLRHYRRHFKEPDFSLNSLNDLERMRNCTIKRLMRYVIDL